MINKDHDELIITVINRFDVIKPWLIKYPISEVNDKVGALASLICRGHRDLEPLDRIVKVLQKPYGDSPDQASVWYSRFHIMTTLDELEAIVEKLRREHDRYRSYHS